MGTVLNQLAEYVGYELVSTDKSVLKTYTRRLPGMQRRMKRISVEDGFALLAGRGLETVYDHVARSIKHEPRKTPYPKPMNDSEVTAEILKDFVQVSGVSALLRGFPVDISSAAERHAGRCESTASSRLPEDAGLYQAVIGGLEQKAPIPSVRKLIDWYDSPTGQKVLELEQQEIDDASFQQFIMDEGRADRIRQIYDHTVSGRGIASIAVELDYAGWLLSGCIQKVAASGDVEQMSRETDLGQGIKKKQAKLESLLREDMLQSLAYLFSSLSEPELTEYADVITEHADVFSELERSIIDAIAMETTLDIGARGSKR